jgi:hypothetical protein
MIVAAIEPVLPGGMIHDVDRRVFLECHSDKAIDGLIQVRPARNEELPREEKRSDGLSAAFETAVGVIYSIAAEQSDRSRKELPTTAAANEYSRGFRAAQPVRYRIGPIVRRLCAGCGQAWGRLGDAASGSAPSKTLQ